MAACHVLRGQRAIGATTGLAATLVPRKGELLTSGNFAPDASSRIVALRKRQYHMLKGIMA